MTNMTRLPFLHPTQHFYLTGERGKNRTTLFPELLSPTATQLLSVFIINNYWLLLLLIPQVQDYVHFHYKYLSGVIYHCQS